MPASSRLIFTVGRSVLLAVNRSKPEAVAAAREVRTLISAYGNFLGEADAQSRNTPPAAKDADLIVTLGGDGTLLGQARRCADLGIPMLGVNFGKLGFLAEYDLATVRDSAATLFGSGDLHFREVFLLDADVFLPGRKRPYYSGIALNELVITAGPPYRMIEMALSIDRSPGPILRGDGLIVSTPVGSTAYNLSAGGPLVAPNVEALVITPIAPQSLAFRPIVVAPDSVIEIELLRVNGSSPQAGTALVFDGQKLVPLEKGVRIRISRHKRTVRFVTNPGSNFWATLINKLRWAMAPNLEG